MGKAERNRNLNARAKIAEQQASMRRSEQRRRLLTVSGAVVLVLVIVVAIFVIKGLSTPPKQKGSSGLPPSVATDVASVPVSTLAKIGTGPLPTPKTGLPLKPISDTTLTSADGKPEMLYIGAEFCPYCAAMRWSMAVALSRFGTFGPLKGIHSSSTDVYPNTATLTFYKQDYSSPYLTFTPVENENVNHGPLQPTTKTQQMLWKKYDTTQGAVGYPFIYFGGKVIITGPLYSPAVLHGLTWSQIAGQLSNPSSTVAQNVNGAANYITASICKMTNNTPSSVCKAAPIPAVEAKI
jgi:hypothetical protein